MRSVRQGTLVPWDNSKVWTIHETIPQQEDATTVPADMPAGGYNRKSAKRSDSTEDYAAFDGTPGYCHPVRIVRWLDHVRGCLTHRWHHVQLAKNPPASSEFHLTEAAHTLHFRKGTKHSAQKFRQFATECRAVAQGV